MKYLSIYKASAGSGKTHALTGEYLRLAFQSVNAFSGILAVTFTNKASEEMKSRILEELNILCQNPTQSPHFDTIKKNYTFLSDEEIRERALDIRTNILHNYNLFAISTIDSFVQRVIRSFSYEIGVRGGYRLEMDTPKVIDDLVDILFKSFADDKALKEWLVTYAFHKIDEGKNWDFRSEMKVLAREIFAENFQTMLKELEQKEGFRERLFALLKMVKKQISDFESKLKEISKEAEKRLKQISEVPEKPGRNFTTISNYLVNKISLPKKTEDVVPLKTINAALLGIDNWMVKKPKPEVRAFIETLYPQWIGLLNEAVGFVNENLINYITASNVMQNVHAFGILSDMASYLSQYREENHLLLISDTTLILKEILAANEASFIYEKTGHRFRHILIDEFQDTSDFQWQNFKPLINNAIAEGNQNLLVGDVKQSIYRWRGGDWSLLYSKIQKQIGQNLIQEINLDNNWRSLQHVIDFNNALFYALPMMLQNHFNSELNEVEDESMKEVMQAFREILVNAYSDSYQHIPRADKKRKGEVRINFYIKPEEEEAKTNWRMTVNEKLPLLIEDLIVNQNYSASDITILTRRNKDGREVFRVLNDYQNENPEALQYNVISSESLFIYTSKSVRILVSALSYLFNPEDLIHLSNLVYEFQNGNEGFSYHDFFSVHKKPEQLQEYLPKSFFDEYEHLKSKSLFELVESLIVIFDLDKDAEQEIYIRTFQDNVYNFSVEFGSSLADFLEWWEQHCLNISVQLEGEQDAVSIMTIHKSKGLGFKVVVIPYCDWKVEESGGLVSTILWANTATSKFKEFPFLPVKYKKDLLSSHFSFDYIEEKLFQYMDALNMLYVAFTRAKEKLFIMAERPDKIRFPGSVGDMLFNVVTSQIAMPDDKKYIALDEFYDETDSFMQLGTSTELAEQATKKEVESVGLDEYKVTQWKDKLKIITHSGDFFIQSIKSVAEKVNYGSLMHEIFARIKTKNDVEDALKTIYFQGKISAIQMHELKEKIEEIISRDKIKSWFTNESQIITEKAIINQNGETKIPDRVIIDNDKVLVIDFKFGKPNPKYQEQVQEYISLFKEMGHENVSGVLYYAELDEIEEVL